MIVYSADLENLITFHCSFCISSFSALCSDFENETIYISNWWCYTKFGYCECKPPDAAFDCKHSKNLGPDPFCFQLQLKLGLVCVHWLCEYLMCNPKFWLCKEAGVERLGFGFFCSLNGSSAAAPRSPHVEPVPSQAVASAHPAPSRAEPKHKSISILLAFPIFIHVHGAGMRHRNEPGGVLGAY